MIKNIAKIASGTAVSQIVLILATPILAKLYSPSDFGVYSSVIAASGFVSILSTLKFDVAIPMADQEDVNNLTLFAFFLSLLVSFAILALSFGAPSMINALIESDSPRLTGVSLSLVALGTSVYQIALAGAYRDSKFSEAAKARVARSIYQTASQILMGIGSFGKGLLIGVVIGKFSGVRYLINKNYFSLKNTRLNIKHIFKKYIDFPKYQMTSSVIGVASVQLVVLFINNGFGSDRAGKYGMALQLLAIPSSLIAQSVSEVLYPTMAKIKDDTKKLSILISNSISILSSISIVVYTLIVLWSPYVVPRVIGDKWSGVSQLLILLSPWMMASFVSSSISSYAIVANKQNIGTAIVLLEAISRSLILYIGIFVINDFTETVKLFSLIGFLICLSYILWIKHISKSKFSKFESVNMFAMIFIGIVVFVSETSLPGVMFSLAASMFVIILSLFYFVKIRKLVSGNTGDETSLIF